MNTKAISVMALVTAVVVGGIAAAQTIETTTITTQVVTRPKTTVVTSSGLNWTDGPPGLPAGAKISVLQGDPSQPGPFTVRLKFPAGYKIPAHHHPSDENVTVIQGTFGVGMGDVLDTKQGNLMSVGSFVHMPKGHNHFAWAKTPVIVQLHSTGPFVITYVNPADDPRKLAQPTTSN